MANDFDADRAVVSRGHAPLARGRDAHGRVRAEQHADARGRLDG